MHTLSSQHSIKKVDMLSTQYVASDKKYTYIMIEMYIYKDKK
ncbi:hypothetical protein CHCC20335_2474 [Bacillus paralicheniformis]|nr:hypothetical protein CHCC20335_2474 [Bacillus paralicheniformis]